MGTDHSAECFIITLDDLYDLIVSLYFQYIVVFVDETEPEGEEVVTYAVTYVLGRIPGKERLLLADDLVVVFCFCSTETFISEMAVSETAVKGYRLFI